MLNNVNRIEDILHELFKRNFLDSKIPLSKALSARIKLFPLFLENSIPSSICNYDDVKKYNFLDNLPDHFYLIPMSTQIFHFYNPNKDKNTTKEIYLILYNYGYNHYIKSINSVFYENTEFINSRFYFMNVNKILFTQSLQYDYNDLKYDKNRTTFLKSTSYTKNVLEYLKNIEEKDSYDADMFFSSINTSVDKIIQEEKIFNLNTQVINLNNIKVFDSEDFIDKIKNNNDLKFINLNLELNNNSKLYNFYAYDERIPLFGFHYIVVSNSKQEIKDENLKFDFVFNYDFTEDKNIILYSSEEFLMPESKFNSLKTKNKNDIQIIKPKKLDINMKSEILSSTNGNIINLQTNNDNTSNKKIQFNYKSMEEINQSVIKNSIRTFNGVLKTFISK